MNTDIDGTIVELKRLDSQFADVQKTRKSTEQRIWGAAARYIKFIGGSEDEKLDKPAIEALKKKIRDRKLSEDNPVAVICEVYVQTYELLKAEEAAIKKAMIAFAKELPVADWMTRQKGAGVFNLARVIANAGADLNNYPGPANLWSRFGLHVVNGAAPKPRKGETLGYSLERRAIAHNLGDCLMKQGEYWRQVYLDRKVYEVKQAEAAGLKVLPSAKIPKKDAKSYRSEGHVHKRALRYMQKKFLEALWQEWTGNERDMNLPDFITVNKLREHNAAELEGAPA